MEEPQEQLDSEEESTPLHAAVNIEMRLIVLGRARSGKSSVGNVVLGDQVFETHSDSETVHTAVCERKRGTLANRKVAVVDTPDWFCSDRPLEEVQRQISLCAALVAPGPHALLLCIPLQGEVDLGPQALEALRGVFGPEAVSAHTLVLFTYADQLDVEGLSLEEYISTQPNLVELLEHCGGHHHALERGRGEEKERESVEELLKKVEQMCEESGTEFYTSELFQQAEGRIKERQREILRQRGEGEDGGRGDEEGAREEAEMSVDDLEVDGAGALCPPSTPRSFLRSVWDGVTGWVRSLFGMVSLESLLGAFVRLFVGGQLGGAVGATVGSVATEVGRRKRLKAN